MSQIDLILDVYPRRQRGAKGARGCVKGRSRGLRRRQGAPEGRLGRAKGASGWAAKTQLNQLRSYIVISILPSNTL